MGKYAHIITCRVTESFPLFQTDGVLNTSRVRAGIKSDAKNAITRLVIFKRKQSTPERLIGRSLLRRYELASMNDSNGGHGECDYNVTFCRKCADCILYGFAIGDGGSEKSKVVVDSSYSITAFDDSHIKLTLNAPFEGGTMSREGVTTSRINSQDHVIPQTFFPSIVTIKDPTEAGFIYVLNNLIRTKSYGAQTTRTGRMRNIILGVVFADGEITSNLRLTQASYDYLSEHNKLSIHDPLIEDDVTASINNALPALLSDDGVAYQYIEGGDLQHLLSEVKNITESEKNIKSLLQTVNDQAGEYAAKYILPRKSK